jgi:hypothetical protein
VVKQPFKLPLNSTFSVSASCGNGEVATGGGFDIGTSTAGVVPLDSFPEGDPPTGWTATFVNTGQQEPTVTTYVVCQRVS